MIGGEFMRRNWQEIRLPDHEAATVQLGLKIDERLYNLLDSASKKYGWGGKRRIIEDALVKVFAETDFEN